MKIGFDGKRAVQNNTGLGNYSRYVLEALQTYYPNEEYILYAPKKRKNPRLEPILSKDNTTLRLPTSTIWKRLSSLWRIWGASTDATNDGVSIFHGLSNELPLNIHRNPQIKSVLTIHDLIFRRLPQCYRFADRLIYNYKFRKSCQNADRIIAVSECTKRDIVKDYGISPDKIEVIYQGCDSAFAQIVDESKKEEVRSKYRLPEHYILSVGSIEERKNTLLIAKALKHLPKETHLVLVGKETAYTEKIHTYIKAENLESRVHILHGIPFADLPAIYQCAEVFAYPSRYEGFGIPILEALNSRLPVVAATGSCLEEAGGPDSLYVNPDSAEEMAQAINKAMQPAQREYMIDKGLAWAAQFSKEQMARQTMQCYNKLIKSGNIQL